MLLPLLKASIKTEDKVHFSRFFDAIDLSRKEG